MTKTRYYQDSDKYQIITVFTGLLNDQEARFLLNEAINNLIQRGIVDDDYDIEYQYVPWNSSINVRISNYKIANALCMLNLDGTSRKSYTAIAGSGEGTTSLMDEMKEMKFDKEYLKSIRCLINKITMKMACKLADDVCDSNANIHTIDAHIKMVFDIAHTQPGNCLCFAKFLQRLAYNCLNKDSCRKLHSHNVAHMLILEYVRKSIDSILVEEPTTPSSDSSSSGIGIVEFIVSSNDDIRNKFTFIVYLYMTSLIDQKLFISMVSRLVDMGANHDISLDIVLNGLKMCICILDDISKTDADAILDDLDAAISKREGSSNYNKYKFNMMDIRDIREGKARSAKPKVDFEFDKEMYVMFSSSIESKRIRPLVTFNYINLDTERRIEAIKCNNWYKPEMRRATISCLKLTSSCKPSRFIIGRRLPYDMDKNWLENEFNKYSNDDDYPRYEYEQTRGPFGLCVTVEFSPNPDLCMDSHCALSMMSPKYMKPNEIGIEGFNKSNKVIELKFEYIRCH